MSATINFTPNDIVLIIKGLQKLPYEESAGLISRIIEANKPDKPPEKPDKPAEKKKE